MLDAQLLSVYMCTANSSCWVIAQLLCYYYIVYCWVTVLHGASPVDCKICPDYRNYYLVRVGVGRVKRLSLSMCVCD